MSGPDSLATKLEFLQKELMGDVHALVTVVQEAAGQVQAAAAQAVAAAREAKESPAVAQRLETLEKRGSMVERIKNDAVIGAANELKAAARQFSEAASQHSAKLNDTQEAAGRAEKKAGELAGAIDRHKAALDQRYAELIDALRGVQTSFDAQAEHVAETVQGGEWRIALKVGAVVVVIELVRFALSHLLHIG